MICPNCGRHFDTLRDRWQRARAADGRAAGFLWAHRRPDNERSCPYVDAGPSPRYAETGTARILVAITEQRDAQEQARMAR